MKTAKKIIIEFRSILNFQIGDDAELMPKEIITAMVTIKKAAAKVNTQLNGLPKEISEAIQQAADEVRILSVMLLFLLKLLGFER